MTKYIAMLRGINVSGQKKIKMSDLALIMEKVGLKNVQTYIQSGNIIFDYKPANPEKIADIISKCIKGKYEFDVPAIVITPSDIQNVIENNPWKDEDKKDTERIYVTFLSANPSRENLSKLSTVQYDNEEFIINKNIVYFYAGSGYGRAKMNNNFFEKKLNVFATTRNWRTILKLSDLSKL